MPKPKLLLSKLSIAEKIQLAKTIMQSMDNNANFPTPDPTLVTLKTSIENLEKSVTDALEARKIAEEKTAKQVQNIKILDATLTSLALYVEKISEGNKEKILSAGMQISDNKKTFSTIGQVKNLVAKEGAKSQEIALTWESVKGAKSYIVACSETSSNDWQIKTVSTKRSVSLNNLKSGTQYWFRVCAVGSSGNGAYSDPATKFAP
jgi:chromosome segregation ATPase